MRMSAVCSRNSNLPWFATISSPRAMLDED
jgi:hypothetical protein